MKEKLISYPSNVSRSMRLRKNSHLSGLLPLALGCLLAVFLITSPQAQAQNLPQYGSDKHLGVATCASSFCHGSVLERDSYSVLQNEYLIWSKRDAHSAAYRVLLNAESKRIANNLSIGAPEKAAICLDCHADNVPEAMRGPEFQLADGIGCEACHGGSERWIASHVDGKPSHEKNIRQGMYPTADPVARAELCLSCHLGTEDKFTTHRIMGAGHPRLSFELDTFTHIQPAHFKVDKDYLKRKPHSQPAQTWALGQVAAAEQALALIRSPQFFAQQGLFPELSFFDCQACHHPLTAAQWQPRARLGNIGPGQVRLNDASLVMVRAIADVVAPKQGRAISQGLKNLHQATSQSIKATQAAAASIIKQLQAFNRLLKQRPITTAQSSRIIKALTQYGQRGDLNDYVAAEQATMACQLLAIHAQRYLELESKIKALYSAVEKETAYNPRQFQRVMANLAKAL